jgi:hypothetical protein
MGMLHQVKQVLKPLLIRLGRGKSVQHGALRLVYLSRFHDWCRLHPSPSFVTPQALYQAALDTLPVDRPINYLEFGVYRGGSIRWWLEHQRNPASCFAGFDTFTGLPEDWTSDKPKGTFSTSGVPPEVGDARCRFLVGLFQDTLVAFLGEVDWQRPTVVHLDADLYSSTLFVLLTVVPRLKAGDVLIFDEFQDYLDEYRAFENLCAAYSFAYDVIGQNAEYTRVALRLR